MQIGKEDYMITYLGGYKDSTRKCLDSIDTFIKVEESKIKIKNQHSSDTNQAN